MSSRQMLTAARHLATVTAAPALAAQGRPIIGPGTDTTATGRFCG